jgi:hypothetical protein
MVWNTGLNRLRNGTSSNLLFLDLEDPSWAAVLQPGSTLISGPVFPWCENSWEVRRKAFRIHRGTNTSAPVILHMFQNYRDDTCYFTRGGSTTWSSRTDMGEGPSSYLDVTINADEIPTAVASIAFLAPRLLSADEDEEDGEAAMKAALAQLRRSVEDEGLT